MACCLCQRALENIWGVGEEEATYTDRYEVVEAVLPPSETSLVHGIAIHPTKTWSGLFSPTRFCDACALLVADLGWDPAFGQPMHNP